MGALRVIPERSRFNQPVTSRREHDAPTDYIIGTARSRMRRNRWVLIITAVMGSESFAPEVPNPPWVRNNRKEMHLINIRSAQISFAYLNLKTYRNHAELSKFRFRTNVIPRIAELMGWHGGNMKNVRYRCGSMMACCIVLGKLVTPCRWYDLEPFSGMRASQKSNFFRRLLGVSLAAEKSVDYVLNGLVRRKRRKLS